ncbi:hypothetical protein [Elizabethkingia miricola]|uniref:hypothetical protein n=1 Tax=Elizabethkingia miricola TaxID=172045 RepID=UPI003891C48B
MNPYVNQELIIRKIKKYNKDNLLQNLYFILKRADLDNKKNYPIWQCLLLIKWTYLYGKENAKENISAKKLNTLLKYMEEFENKTFNPLLKVDDWDTIFQIKTYQQFYLQQEVHWSDFARQLKLYGNSLKSRHDIDKAFNEITGMKISDFIFFIYIIWFFTISDKTNYGNYTYRGYIENGIFEFLKNVYKYDTESDSFIKLLTFNQKNAIKLIKQFNTGLKQSNLQAFEMSCFTQFPFIYKDGKYEIIHRDIFNYTAHYYIYDYMKNCDNKFSIEFGRRFEKYVELGIKESKINYKTEKDLVFEFGQNEKVIDFLLNNQVLVECKSIEPKPLPSVMPEDSIVYRSLRSSIIKAYLDQMLNVVKQKKELDKPLYGIIITYKDFYYSSLSDLNNIIKDEVENICKENGWSINPLPPENVFVINLTSWDVIVEILKEGKCTLPELLKNAVDTNKNQKTRWFYGFLKQYLAPQGKVSYLEKENQTLKNTISSRKRL